MVEALFVILQQSLEVLADCLFTGTLPFRKLLVATKARQNREQILFLLLADIEIRVSWRPPLDASFLA